MTEVIIYESAEKTNSVPYISVYFRVFRGLIQNFFSVFHTNLTVPEFPSIMKIHGYQI